MGSYAFIDFKNFSDASVHDGSGEKAADHYLLARQSSIFSLTFDEFQSTMGGPGKDFGSMNMEDLLKSIWTAGESQTVASSPCLGSEDASSGNLQRQGSLTLPRTLSQKTVDEVWRDVLKETVGMQEKSGTGSSNMAAGEPTLGEVTLEEFLFRAGVVREDTQPSGRPNSSGIYNGGLTMANCDNAGLTAGFQQLSRGPSLLGSQLSEQSSRVLSSPNVEASLNGANLSNIRPLQHQTQLQPLLPKQTTLAFTSPTPLGTSGHLCPETKTPVMTSPLSNTVQDGSLFMGKSCNGPAVPRGSPRSHLHSDAIVSKIESQSLAPLPYIFPEGGRGRRSSTTLEKVVERRRRRMIKNRESAARSRARKQAYTLELEAEIAMLKEMNEELQKKQEEFMEMLKNQNSETKNLPWRGKRICLKRTLTGPW